MSRLLALFGFPLRFLLSCFGSSLQGGLGLGQGAGGLPASMRSGEARLDVASQMLAKFGIEFLGRAGISERGG